MAPRSPLSGVGRPRDAGKRAAILAAAQNLFAAQGYLATSMDAVARTAGTSKLTAYRHFGSKDELFAAAIAERCTQMLELAVADDQQDDDPQAALVGFGRAFLGLILHEDAIAVHRLVISEHARAPQLGRLFHAAAIIPTQDRLARLIRRLDLPVDSADDAATDLLSLWRSKPMLPIEMGMEQWSADQIESHLHRSVKLCLAAWGFCQ